MSDITRRQVLGGTVAAVAAAAATGVIEPRPAEAGPADGPPVEVSQTSAYKYRLAEAPLERYNGGTKRQVTSKELPSSPSISGAIVVLEPGGVREPHWHPNCIEWDYVAAGSFRFNIMDPKGKSETFDVSAGDVVVIPQGFAHYFENVGAEPATLILTFNAGEFEEIGISQWVAKTPKGSFEVALNLPGEALAHAPDHSLFITSHKNPGK